MTVTWPATAIKHVARVRYGLGQPPPSQPDGIPILRATNIFRGTIRSAGLIYAELKDLPLDRAPLLKAGEILVVRSGAYTGDSALVTREWEGAAPGYDLRITPERCDPRFLAYTLLSAPVAHQIEIASSRAAQPHLNAEELGEVRIDLAPLEEQRRIADFLDAETARIDQLASLRRTQSALLSERWQAQLSDTASGFIDKYGAIALRHVLLSIRQGWSPQCDDRLAEPDEWGVVKAGCVNGGVFREEQHKALPAEVEPRLQYKLAPGDLLMSRASGSLDLIGSVAVIPEFDRKLLLCDKVYRLRVNPRSAREDFVAHMLRTRAVREYIKLGVSGAEGMANNLPTAVVRGCRIPNAPLQEQAHIVATLNADASIVEAAQDALSNQTALLEERRRAVVTAAVTGNLDVTTARSVA